MWFLSKPKKEKKKSKQKPVRLYSDPVNSVSLVSLSTWSWSNPHVGLQTFGYWPLGLDSQRDETGSEDGSRNP